MSMITTIGGIIIASSMLYTSYPQEVLITSELCVQNKIEVGEKSINKNFNYLKEDIKLPQVVGGSDETKIKIINNVINNNILPSVEDAEKTAKEYFGSQGQGSPTFPYEIYSKYTVSTSDSKLLSLYNDYYEYLGGAHGNTIRTSYTIDKDKESLISLKDLFISGYDYKSTIDKEIKNQISKNPDIYFDSGNEFKGISENQSFYIDNDNLVIYYQLYDIAPYVTGIPEFKIPLKVFDKNIIYHK